MILLTGASGFLGHHLVSEFSQREETLRALVRPQSDITYLKQKGVELAVTSDIGDRRALRGACEGCRAVVHAAGHFRMWGNLCHFWETNVRGTDAVLRAALQAGVQRVVYVSTVVVVGRTEAGRVVDETHLCRPQDAYQRTKWEAEQLALAYGRHCGMEVVIARPGALYGPWGRYAFNRLFFEDPLRGLRIKVDDGRRLTFPAFAPDAARGIGAALDKGRAGQIYHLCGPSLTHNEANEAISDAAGISRRRLNMPSRPLVFLARLWTLASRFTGREPFYPVNLAHYVFQDWQVSSEKARAELGFETTPFDRGARLTLEWYGREGIL
jgi:dihydroflavonol-4-reductase